MPPICITLGDPAGIGPEVTFKALHTLHSHPGIILFMHKQCQHHPDNHIKLSEFNGQIEPGEIKAVYVGKTLTPTTKPNDPVNAKIAHESLIEALNFCKKSKAALVTAPISKAGFQAAKIPFTGHTTLLKHYFNTPNASMAFHSNKLNVILSTIHIPLSHVEEALTQALIIETIKNAITFGQKLGIKKPRIGIAGLNPHASENGQFGSFENNTLIPVIRSLSFPDASVSGPISPDIIFKQALEKHWDIVVALYHDQGLIPVKLLAFDSAVNVTIGLPICRTSPDHGTAYDIAGKGIANHRAMASAIQYAITYGS